MDCNYLQIVEQTFDEKLEMYMKSDKETLANMLVAGNKYYPTIEPNSFDIFMKLDKHELAELLTVRDKYDAATNPNSMEYYKYFEKTNSETNESTSITYSNTTIE